VSATVLRIDLGSGGSARSQLDDPSLLGPVDWAAHEGGDDTFLGAGPLSLAEVPGSNRLVIAGRSPLWCGFYVSTMGSAGGALRGAGVDLVRLSGSASRPSVLYLGPDARVRIDPVDPDEVWAGDPGGTAPLLSWLKGRAEGPSRCLAVGPASRSTRMGAIASALFRSGEPVTIETWAGRGGFGSKLFQQHGLVAIVFSGEPPTRRRLHDMVVAPADVERATIKYRYHPQLKTGGTFGSNFTNLREKMLAWNARSVLDTPERRLEAYERLVERHYLRQFNEEIVARGRGRDCGETCPAVCKKVSDGHKKDYQPYAALGPNIGVFDHRAAERVNAVADGLGFDSVEAGGLVGWGFELVCEGLVEASDLGLAHAPRFEADGFDPVEDSARNAELAGALLRSVVAGDRPLTAAMQGGLRAAAASVGGDGKERALYVANGDDGSVCPNQYWVPGMLAPVPVSGKYYVDYGFDFRPPRELGRSCAARMIREIGLDNVGLCRFQREWAEPRMDDLLRAAGWTAIGDVDLHHAALSRRVALQAQPRGLETRRAKELLAGWIEEVRRDDAHSDELEGWVTRFRSDRDAAADAWWEDMRIGIGQGLS